MTKTELRKLRKNLPKGAFKKIAIQFGMHEFSVRNVLSGSRNNPEVVNEAIRIAEEHKKMLRDQSKKTKAL
jgi:predicted aldo/keto reductase-like oxidoreductase